LIDHPRHDEGHQGDDHDDRGDAERRGVNQSGQHLAANGLFAFQEIGEAFENVGQSARTLACRDHRAIERGKGCALASHGIGQAIALGHAGIDREQQSPRRGPLDLKRDRAERFLDRHHADERCELPRHERKRPAADPIAPEMKAGGW
jgi:hypothetical protein